MYLKLVTLFVIVTLIAAVYDPKLDEELSEEYILEKLAEIRKMEEVYSAEIRKMEEVYLAALKDQKKIVKEMKKVHNILDKQEL